jgi:hypothetical protein
MIQVKGFYSVPKSVNNMPNVKAVFGELSQYANTFARDYKTYTKGTSQLSFCSFSSKNGDTPIELGLEFSNIACEVGDFCYLIGPNISNSNTKEDFAQQVQSEFGSRIRTVICGDLVTDSTRRMPKWISWEVLGQNVTYRYKVWLASADFELSYDEFQILVVPPVVPIDRLFMPYADLLLELARNDMAIMHERVNTTRGEIPETIIRTEMVELIDKTNTNNRANIGWTVLIYGPAGDTTDHIKDAIKKYISNNSTSTENDWRQLMPDLFNTTCFYVIPRWDRFAIQPRLGMPGIQSPLVGTLENYNYTKNLTKSYIPAAHFDANMEDTFHRYQHLKLNIIGGEFNRLNKYKFSDYFPDYIAESTVNEDFNRQSTETKEISTLLATILLKIDLYEKDPTLGSALRLIEKYGQRFIVGKYMNIEYYVLMKPSQQP